MKNSSQKGFTLLLVAAIVTLVVVTGGVSYFATKQQLLIKEDAIIKPDSMIEKKDNGTMIKPEDTLVVEKSKDEMMRGETTMKYSGTVLAGKSALLFDFKKDDYDAVVRSDKLIVLYFYANWCPICKAEFPIMQEVFNELATDKVVGFRVSYNDNETDNDEKNLAKQFGVAYQHTKVFVKNGERILKSPESWDDKRYDMEINKALTQ